MEIAWMLWLMDQKRRIAMGSGNADAERCRGRFVVAVQTPSQGRGSGIYFTQMSRRGPAHS